MKRLLAYLLLLPLMLAHMHVSAQTTFKVSSGQVNMKGGVKMVFRNTSLENNGTFEADSGTAFFKGTLADTVRGSQAPRFEKVEIHKTGTNVALEVNAYVADTLLFTEGSLILLSGNLFLGAENGVLVGESETNRISGEGGEIFKKSFLNAPVSANPGNLGLFISSGTNLDSVELIRGHLAPTLVGNQSIARYFKVNPTNPGLGTLRFSYFEAELNGLTEADLQLYQSSDNGATWTFVGKTQQNTGSNWVEFAGANLAGMWALAGCPPNGDTTQVTLFTCDVSSVGVTYTPLTNQFGCDSIIETTTTLQAGSTTNLSANTCDPTLAGVFQQTLTNQFGCDSVVITTVTYTPPDTTNLTATTCDPALEGISTVTYMNQAGCDSLVITNTTLLPSDTTYISLTSCDPSAVGVVPNLLTNQFGCDSLVITTTTLSPSDTTYISLTSCDPNAVGVVPNLLTNQFGCDSLVITTTTLSPSDTTYISLTSCDPSAVGVVPNLLTNQFGCDSLVITTTTLSPSDTTYISLTSCDPSAVGVVPNLLTNQFGCDSLVITTTTLSPSDTTYISLTSCDPNAVGVVPNLLTNQFGCDSLVITTTTLSPSDTTYISLTSCDPSAVGVVPNLLTNQFGCDSLVITTTTLLPSDTTEILLSTCDPNEVGVIPTVLTNQFGCDSLVLITTTLDVSGGCCSITIATTHIDETCERAEDGSITIVGSSSTATYEYSIDGGLTWQSDGQYDNLPMGPYYAIVRDADNTSCMSDTNIVNIAPGIGLPTFSTLAQHGSCLGAFDGSIEVTPNSGTAPYSYSIDGGSFVAGGEPYTFTNVAAGDHFIRIQDASGCISEVTEVVTTASLPPTLKVQGVTDASSATATDGSFRVTPLSGEGPFMYSMDGGQTYVNGNSPHLFDNVAAGCYEVQIQDVNGCESEDRTFCVNDLAVCPPRADINRMFKKNATRNNNQLRNVCEGGIFEHYYKLRYLSGGNQMRIDWTLEEATGKVNERATYNGSVPAPDAIQGSDGPNGNGTYIFDANNGILGLEDMADRSDQLIFQLRPVLLTNGAECSADPTEVKAIVYPTPEVELDNASQPGQTLRINSGDNPNETVSVESPVAINENKALLQYDLYIAATSGITELTSPVDIIGYGADNTNFDYDGFEVLADSAGITTFTNTTNMPITVTIEITPRLVPSDKDASTCVGVTETIDMIVLPQSTLFGTREVYLDPGKDVSGLYLVYPNPAHEEVTVEIPRGLDKPHKLVLTDLRGRTISIQEMAPEQTKTLVDLRTVTEGVYLLHIRTEDGKPITKKIIRE